MDLQRRAALLQHLERHGFSAEHPRGTGARPLLGLAEFFEGNNDDRSLGPQIAGPHPGVQVLHERLREIAARADVSHVLVEATNAEWAYDSDDEWVVAERVVIVSSAPAELVAEWRRELGAAGQVKGMPQPLAANAPAIGEDQAAWQLVWT